MFTALFRISRTVPGVDRIVKVIYKCDIPRKTQMGRVTFGHNALGVVIHPQTKIGNNVFFQHHASTGVRWPGDKLPVLQDNVRIGAYAILLGPITIGENSVIGAGSIVTHDVPANSIFYNKKVDTIVQKTEDFGRQKSNC